jgi:zinc finger CCHC domain-containing protein 9
LTCFACRESGHAAADCPKAQNASASDAGVVTGICYRYASAHVCRIGTLALQGCLARCGSTRHTLSKCKKPVDPQHPLPFASCFVCSGQGHLASTCPSNEAKGIYPNGGCCKLCGETSHLARNCPVRKDIASKFLLFKNSLSYKALSFLDDS